MLLLYICPYFSGRTRSTVVPRYFQRYYGTSIMTRKVEAYIQVYIILLLLYICPYFSGHTRCTAVPLEVSRYRGTSSTTRKVGAYIQKKHYYVILYICPSFSGHTRCTAVPLEVSRYRGTFQCYPKSRFRVCNQVQGVQPGSGCATRFRMCNQVQGRSNIKYSYIYVPTFRVIPRYRSTAKH